MNRNLWWKVILIVAVLVIFVVAIVPTEKRPDTIKLGLDLKGGTQLVMQVNTVDALRAEVDQAIERYKSQAAKAQLPVPEARRNTDTSLVIVLPTAMTADNYEKLGSDWLPEFDASRTDTGLEFRLKPTTVTSLEDQTVERAKETINNRVDALGVAEHIIARQGGPRGNRLLLQLPGVDDPARVKEIIKTTAQLQFRIVEGQVGPDPQSVLSTVPTTIRGDVEILPGNSYDDFGRVVGRQYYAVRKSVPVTGSDLKTARVTQGRLGEPIIGFSMTPEGGRKFAALTGANVGRQLAIVLDKNIESAPKINSKIEDEGVIEGQFTPQEAADLALVLRSGSLPASLTTLEERTVGPSLGRDSIRDGVTASLIGFTLVVLAVLAYYKGAGVNAVIALLINLVILLGFMAYFRAALTLPGIAGIILTLAMAIDSNVLVFERIREELRAGKSIRAAIDTGFSLAFGTIIDAHLTTIISALFLFQFGSGPVQGFAVTLLIGLAASVFTAFFVSRVIFDIIYGRANRPATISI